jgi:superfamily I DNA/RNA helicase
MTSPSILAAIQQRNKLFVSGPFGSGKTTLAIERIRWLLTQERVRGDDILVLVPQRTVGRPYLQALRRPEIPPGPPVRISTVAGLARNSVELYWPLLAREAGFENPEREPTFLNLETAQFHMAELVDAAFERGDFDGIRVERNRVISQILDNLNKAALYGLGIEETYRRLALTIPQGEHRQARLNALRAARHISEQFRQLCLKESLVDFSLWIQLFNEQALTNPWIRTHLFRSFRHVVLDNAEEDTYTAHGLLQQWLPHLESALILCDEDAGFRVFLGADPVGADELAVRCDQKLRLVHRYVTPPLLRRLERAVDAAILGTRQAAQRRKEDQPLEDESHEDESHENESYGDEPRENEPREPLPLHYEPHRFYPQMIQWVVNEIDRLVTDDGVPPGEIAVVAPFVSDALRFSLQNGLEARGIPSTSHRPSRALRAEPAARCLLTLAALAHPAWQIYPAPADVTTTLRLAIQDLDPVRAHLLSRVAYTAQGERSGELRPFAQLKPAVQQRITYRAGEKYDQLRSWLAAYRTEPEFTPLDQFVARIFGEVLSQPGFGFHEDPDAARIASQMVESARNFRWAVEESIAAESPAVSSSPDGTTAPQGLSSAQMVGRAYLTLVESGALGAMFVPGWQEDESAVFIAPAYTFLMRNRAVDIQFWLDVGATGWWERLYQPLTHPYVLSRRWPPEKIWTDFDEFERRQEMLRRIVLGLVRRTRKGIYLGISDYGESGLEQRGPLLTLINRILAREKRTIIQLP